MLPKSDFADALRYIRNHWKELNVFVQDGRIPIDNNSVEQLMKQVAMGRKAWLFVCNVEGGEQSAMMMTLVEQRAAARPGRRASTSRTCWTSCSRDEPTTSACCPTSGSRATRKRSACTGSRSDATRPNASRSKPPAVVWPPVDSGGLVPVLAARRQMVLLCGYSAAESLLSPFASRK